MNYLHRLVAVAALAAFFYAGSALAQNAGTVSNHAFAIGKGAGTTGYTSLLCGAAQLAVGQSAADPVCQGVSTILDTQFGTAQGSLIYRNATQWVALAPGVNGQFLKTQGSGANPTWTSGGASLDVRNFATGGQTAATVCTGSGDDTATIQAAADAANAAHGGTIVFPAGACLVASPGINLKNHSGITFSGQGSSLNNSAALTSITYTSATGSLFVGDGSNSVTIEKMAMLTSSGSYSGDLIDLRQVTGASNTFNITIRDCFIYNPSGTAASLIRMGSTLNSRVERCLLQGAVQSIKGGASSNNIYIAHNWFNTNTGTTSHVGIQAEGWTIINNVFEPTAGVATNNIVANGAGFGAAIIGNTINDGGTGTPINLTGAVMSGTVIQGNDIQGGDFSINAGSAVGISIVGNTLLANNICNVIVSSATIVTVHSNSNVNASVCTLPASNTYIIDNANGTLFLSAYALGGSTAHGLLVGQGGTSNITSMAVMTNGQIPVGQTGADPLPKTMSGDCTLAATGAITCTKVNNILPGQPALKVRLAASQSVTTGTKTKIAFDTVDLDTGSNWSSVNKQWNPLISGTYMVCAAMFPLGTSITNVQIFILKNTTDQIINTQASAASVPACTLITMNGTTDFIEADGIVTATSPQFLGASTGQTQMTAYRIGP